MCAMDQHAEQAQSGDRLARLRRALTRHRRTTSGSEAVQTPTAPEPQAPAPEPRSREGERRPAGGLRFGAGLVSQRRLTQPDELQVV